MRGALLCLLIACGSNAPGPHDVIACGSGWQNPDGTPTLAVNCERACESPPVTGSATCKPTGGDFCPAVECNNFIDEDGVLGCCLALAPSNGLPDGTVYFYECADP